MVESLPPRPVKKATVAGRGLATLFAWYAAAVLGLVLLVASLPEHNSDGTCEGIGFGCTPGPRGGALLAVMIVGVPMFVCSLVISSVVLAAALAAKIRSGVAAGTLAAFAGFVGSSVAAVVVLAAS